MNLKNLFEKIKTMILEYDSLHSTRKLEKCNQWISKWKKFGYCASCENKFNLFFM